MIRRILLAGVRFYRRRLSGRGPLAHVRCTFAEFESCAAYAERILGESPSMLRAVARIRRRLARCRHLSLYRLREGRLGWGSGYDRVLTHVSGGVRQLDAALAEDGEGTLVRAAVGRAIARVAQATGARGDVQAALIPLPLIRDGEAVRHACTRRLRRRGVSGLVAAGLGVIAFLTGWNPLPVVLCLLVAGAVLLLTSELLT
jgi:putative component of membrane protein insertase Oxa1/YidC/SpoIIIJ protein YidD